MITCYRKQACRVSESETCCSAFIFCTLSVPLFLLLWNLCLLHTCIEMTDVNGQELAHLKLDTFFLKLQSKWKVDRPYREQPPHVCSNCVWTYTHMDTDQTLADVAAATRMANCLVTGFYWQPRGWVSGASHRQQGVTLAGVKPTVALDGGQGDGAWSSPPPLPCTALHTLAAHSWWFRKHLHLRSWCL